MNQRLGSSAALLAILALVVTTLGVTSPTSSAAAAASIELTADDRPPLPILLSRTEGRPTTLRMYTAGADDVEVTFAGDGLAFDPPSFDLGTTDSADLVVNVRATTGGLHTMTATVTSSVGSDTVTIPRMWAPGGAPLPATGNLGGRNLVDIEFYGKKKAGRRYQDRQALLFLDGTFAYIGFPKKGKPTCTKGSTTRRKGCVRYFYDKQSKLIQIGGAIGRVGKRQIQVSGIGMAQEGQLFNTRAFGFEAGFPSKGKRYRYRWQWKTFSRYHPGDITSATFRLRPNGTFFLRWMTDKDKSTTTTRTGRYRMVGTGRLQLRSKGKRSVHTFVLLRNDQGNLDPRQGLWLRLDGQAIPFPLTRKGGGGGY